MSRFAPSGCLALLMVVLSALECLADTPYEEGVRLYQARYFKQAAKKFEEALGGGNGASEVYIYMAHSYAASGRTADAVRTYLETAEIFKGLPAEPLAKKCLQRLDPKGLWRARIKKIKKQKAEKKGGNAFINRIFVIEPTVRGHPRVSYHTVQIVKTTVSRLPRFIYDILDKADARISIGPNIIDKWPDALNTSKPGMERITLAQEGARSYGTDIYIWERPTQVGSSHLGPPYSARKIQQEILYQLGHGLDASFQMWEDPDFRRQYDADKMILTDNERRGLKYYLQKDYKGSGEVIASVICSYLGGRTNRNVERCFPLSKKWVLARLERAKRAHSRRAKKKSSAKIAIHRVASTKKKFQSDERKPEDVIPDETTVPYTRKVWDKLYVSGTINGARTQMLFDTGAYRVMIGTKELKKLGLEVPTGDKKVVGVGAAGPNYGWIKSYTITVGGIKRTLPVHVVDGSQYVLLGQPFLRNMHYKIDRKSNYIHFVKDSETAKKHVALDAIEIPFRMVEDNMITVISINGRNVEVNFDTGAPYCLFSMRDAKRLKFKPVSEVAVTSVGGTGGLSVAAYTYEIDSIKMGPIKKTNVRVFVTGSGGYSVLGQNFFGHSKFVVDNEKNVIRFSRK